MVAVAVVTAARPMGLARRLETLLSDGRRANGEGGHGPLVTVYDNSSLLEDASKTAAVCRSPGKWGEPPARYFGAAERDSLIRNLVDGGCDADAVHFSLDSS